MTAPQPWRGHVRVAASQLPGQEGNIVSMRQLHSVLGIGLALAGCSGGKGAAGDAAVVDAGADGRAGREGGGVVMTDGGLGANLSWYCPAAGASCAQSDVTTYNRCLLDRCESSLRLCPCESWINCTTRCDCGDLACRAVCIPTFDCLVCGQSVAQCVKGSGCQRPACYEPPDGGADASARPPPVVVVGPAPVPDAATSDGNVPADGGSDGGLQGTCADLRRCCESLAGASAQATCLSQVMLLQSDPLCAAALLVYRGNGLCQ